jgi:hypothetical protein
MMHGRGKSDFAILAVKPANKAEHPAEQSAVEAIMAHVLNEVLLYCCLAAFVTGIALAAASLIS